MSGRERWAALSALSECGRALALAGVGARGRMAALLAVGALALLPAEARAQGGRISGTSVAEFVQIKQLVPDSIPVSQAGDTVPGSVGDLRFGPGGQIVRCVVGALFCNFRRSAATVSGVPLVQDIELSGWGFAQGLRGYVHVRGRADVGNASAFWPLANEPVDVLAAYAELDRGAWRARAGRQWHTSGLGYYDFDGAGLMWRGPRRVSLEGYAGWSLERGLDEPATSDEIRALEPLVPSTRAWIFGAEARWRPDARFSAGATYQRELRTDRAGLFSERGAANARARLYGATLDGQLVYDFAQTQVNEGRLRLQSPVFHRMVLSVEGRRHVPFFELWTIWGAFSPVAFNEGSALLSWTGLQDELQISVGGARRRYEDPGTGLLGFPLRRDGWRFTSDAAWQPRAGWSTQAAFSSQIGFGASRSDESFAVRRLLPRDGYAGFSLQAFQEAYEFRVAEGRVVGLGTELGIGLTGLTRLDGNFYYLHHLDRGPEAPDWSQIRGSLRFSWTLGREPGPRISESGGPQ